jgi:hypothetical protein
MKKSTSLLLTATALLLITFSEGRAQTAKKTEIKTFESEALMTTEPINAVGLSALGKAEKSFYKAYPEATKVEWSTLGDKTSMCRFYVHNNLHRAFYTQNGQWVSTVSSYTGNKLDKRISDNVKSVYYNYDIIFVDQIDMTGNKTIYVVEIQNEKLIRKVRVENDEMEIIQEFEKH